MNALALAALAAETPLTEFAGTVLSTTSSPTAVSGTAISMTASTTASSDTQLLIPTLPELLVMSIPVLILVAFIVLAIALLVPRGRSRSTDPAPAKLAPPAQSDNAAPH